jgi:hypothetical protein
MYVRLISSLTSRLLNMKMYKWFILWLLFSLSVTAGAVSLPSQSYAIYNELYATNNDQVGMSYGTVFRGINHRLRTDNSNWGTVCLANTGQVKGPECMQCCADTYERENTWESDEVVAQYDALKEECDIACGSQEYDPLPLDLPLWFILPLCGLYGIVQRRRNKKQAVA